VALMRKTGTPIALHGVIVGGGLRHDGLGTTRCLARA
jgi:hypothetical protein